MVNHATGHLLEQFAAGSANRDEQIKLFVLFRKGRLSQSDSLRLCDTLLRRREQKVFHPNNSLQLWLTTVATLFAEAGVPLPQVNAFMEFMDGHLPLPAADMDEAARTQHRRPTAESLAELLCGKSFQHQHTAPAPAPLLLYEDPIPAVSRIPSVPLIALVTATFLAGIFWLNHDSAPTCDKKIVINQERLLDLPDASSIITSAATELCYAPALVTKDQHRVVNLQRGSAYFEIAPNPAQPFLVNTVGGATVEVKGTGFNVSADPEQGIARISVAHGLVVVHFNGEAFEVTPEHQLTLNTRTEGTRLESFDPKNVPWPYPKLTFKNVPLEEIARILNNHFHATIIIKNDALKKSTITAEFINEQVTLDNILHTLSLALGKVDYERRGSVVIIHGKPEKPAL
jgi:ferric-dicitrate binding protein FerR (iron transport regulator)